MTRIEPATVRYALLEIRGAPPKYADVPTPSNTEERVMNDALIHVSTEVLIGGRYIHIRIRELILTSSYGRGTSGRYSGRQSLNMHLFVMPDIFEIVVICGGVSSSFEVAN